MSVRTPDCVKVGHMNKRHLFTKSGAICFGGRVLCPKADSASPLRAVALSFGVPASGASLDVKMGASSTPGRA